MWLPPFQATLEMCCAVNIRSEATPCFDWFPRVVRSDYIICPFSIGVGSPDELQWRQAVHSGIAQHQSLCQSCSKTEGTCMCMHVHACVSFSEMLYTQVDFGTIYGSYSMGEYSVRCAAIKAISVSF